MRNLARWGIAGPVLASILLLPLLAWTDGAPSTGPETRLVGLVNLNIATTEQLELLYGVGPARARAIVEHRREHGPFQKVDDLLQVSGIGPRAFARIRAHCTVSGKTTARLEQ